MRTITEVLSTSHSAGAPVKCPFSEAKKHPAKCTCLGSGKVKACESCGGAGFDPRRNDACGTCGGRGALAA